MSGVAVIINDYYHQRRHATGVCQLFNTILANKIPSGALLLAYEGYQGNV